MSTDVSERALLTRFELAELLRVSTRTVDRLARRGVITPVRLVRGGRVVYRSDEVARLLEGR
jgi:excisionase family DNA binding protein